VTGTDGRPVPDGDGSRDGVRVGGLLLRLDPADAEPPFRQLRAQLLAACDRGVVEPGTRLPAVRTLATGLGVAPNTVAKVYRELEVAGVLESRGRSGTFVADSGVRDRAVTQAADEYAAVAASAGLDDGAAVDAVRAALTRLRGGA